MRVPHLGESARDVVELPERFAGLDFLEPMGENPVELPMPEKTKKPRK